MEKMFKDSTLPRNKRNLFSSCIMLLSCIFGIVTLKIFLCCPELPIGHFIFILLVKKNSDQESTCFKSEQRGKKSSIASPLIDFIHMINMVLLILYMGNF